MAAPAGAAHRPRPAPGLRPETLPLTAFAAFLHIPALFHPARLFVLDLSASRAALTVLAVLALAGCAAFAVRFAPADVPPAREARTLTLTLPAEERAAQAEAGRVDSRKGKVESGFCRY
ncbi:MAG: hypothetical protein MdMp014T_0671 [Treponematales bacterium]